MLVSAWCDVSLREKGKEKKERVATRRHFRSPHLILPSLLLFFTPSSVERSDLSVRFLRLFPEPNPNPQVESKLIVVRKRASQQQRRPSPPSSTSPT